MFWKQKCVNRLFHFLKQVSLQILLLFAILCWQEWFSVLKFPSEINAKLYSLLNSDLLPKEKVQNRVSKFYVSAFFNKSIILVDLTSSAVSDVFMCCTVVPVKKCHLPSYLVTSPNGYSLIAVVHMGVIEINTRTGQVELLTHPNGFRRDNPMIDGAFGQAQVYELGPLTPVPGFESTFIFADKILHNLRVLDLSQREFYSVCLSSTDRYLLRNSTIPIPTMSEYEIPFCNLTEPHTVLFTESGQAMLISQSQNITLWNVTCEYKILIGSYHCQSDGSGNRKNLMHFYMTLVR